MRNEGGQWGRLIKNHKLLIREDARAYRAVIISEGKLRLAGAAADTPKAALEALFATTMQMLEVASEAWEANGYAGEEIVTLADGSMIAREVVPEPGAEAEIAMEDAGEGAGEEVDEVAAKAEATVMAKKSRNPKFVYTGRPGRPRRSTAADTVAGEEVKPKRPRGRPRKNAT